MHFLDHLATSCRNDEANRFARSRQRANRGRGEISGNIQGVTLPEILEAHREKQRHSTLSGRDGEVAQTSVVVTHAPLWRIGADCRSASTVCVDDRAVPRRPVGSNRRRGSQTFRERLESFVQLGVSRRGISIKRGRKMTNPRTVDSLSIEDAHERRRIGMRDVAKGIGADERVYVGEQLVCYGLWAIG